MCGLAAIASSFFAVFSRLLSVTVLIGDFDACHCHRIFRFAENYRSDKQILCMQLPQNFPVCGELPHSPTNLIIRTAIKKIGFTIFTEVN